MRLRNIKLSGFKSFVDPTTLNIPGNLVGIVGPNGCGKSNIIDAVTWVMGESSAKHLRGESLTDVIFNGSSARNPVGQASVELQFDNSEDKLGGQYANYDEIAIKRQINRDGISSYFLNGTRCRRRDITAIFLGTGLGPRSYGIIEQGMISRLIEAKPDELRTYIEEAAGISKYRERRRETENRIRHTKENISRLNDIREEIEKQLGHLQRQARSAERYQTLKKEQRKLGAELMALKWKGLNEKSDKQKLECGKQETRVEAVIAELRKTESEIEKYRNELSAANDGFNQAQSSYYQIGGDISQLEQKIQHTHERINNLKHDLAQSEAELQQVMDQKKDDLAKLSTLEIKAKELEPRLKGSRGESDSAYNLLNQAEQAMQGWQSEWDKFNETAAEYVRQDEVGRARISHLELSIDDLKQKIISLEKEQSDIEKSDVEKEKLVQSNNLKVNEDKLKDLKSSLEDQYSRMKSEKEKYDTLNEDLNAKRMQQNKLEGRLESLKTLQNSGSLQDESVLQWLENKGLSAKLCLAKQIEVEPEWTHAVEMVLEKHLQDICVKDIENYESAFSKTGDIQIGMICPDNFKATASHPELPALADKVTSKYPVKNLLTHVYIADSAKSALKMRNSLAQHESVITRDGLWVGAYWIKISNLENTREGMLSREQDINRISKELKAITNLVDELGKKAGQSRTGIADAEKSIVQLQTDMQKQQEVISGYRASLAAIDTRLEQSGSRTEQIDDELVFIQEQIEEEGAELKNLRAELDQVELNQKDVDHQRKELIALREKHRASLENTREAWTQTHELSHGIALQLESNSSQKASLEQSIKRNEMQTGHLGTRIESINKNLQEAESPLNGMQSDFEVKLKSKVSAEKILAEARKKVEGIEDIIREKEQARSTREQGVEGLRDDLEKLRMVVNESQVRLQTIEEQLSTEGADLNQTLESLEEGAELNAWEEKVESVSRKIQRLGPINLAAIEEFTQLSERKNYLDSQHEDLEKALNTLEGAIQKIDKESRTRFRDTFDRLNANLQETFPQLFGGGRASLELTGHDLLETGVTIMARPPGKRNSNIHLLSGGEKALTAVALVFSIFKLNPAPFCILDEVDAPLDDANVSRFSELVSNMSADVQFIFITHNKITMEIANQLLGVTMYEAGVSRLVSVDVDEAVEMVATA